VAALEQSRSVQEDTRSMAASVPGLRRFDGEALLLAPVDFEEELLGVAGLDFADPRDDYRTVCRLRESKT